MLQIQNLVHSGGNVRLKLLNLQVFAGLHRLAVRHKVQNMVLMYFYK